MLILKSRWKHGGSEAATTEGEKAVRTGVSICQRKMSPRLYQREWPEAQGLKEAFGGKRAPPIGKNDLVRGSEKFFYKGLDSRYFQFCETHSLCYILFFFSFFFFKALKM